MILLDLDNFKAVNDNFGHQVGDDLLIFISQLVKYQSRQIDGVGRWGGEELIIICPETNLEGANNLAEKLRIALSQAVFQPVGVTTASFGVVESHPSEQDRQLIERVDKALYRAKAKGRNCVCLG